MQKWDIDTIGTHLTLLLDTEKECGIFFDDLEGFLGEFDARFSRFIVGNWLDLCNKNRRAVLDTDASNMLTGMLEVAKGTDGYFDPTVGKRLIELGYGSRKNYVYNNHIGGHDDYRDIEIHGDEVILHGNSILEFGGAAKGYLIDCLKNRIQEFLGTNNVRYLINFGGDMYGRGGWRVGLESPFASDEVIGMIELDDLFLACSAGTKRKWGDHHHLINPKTGESAHEVVASYIEGDSGMITDMYATTLCVMPWELACHTLTGMDNIHGIIVRKNGELYQKEKSFGQVFI